MQLDPNLAEAHAALGDIDVDEFDWTGAVDNFRRAIELAPEYATAHQYYAVSTAAGSISAYEREYGRAVEQFRATLEMEPGFRYARGWLARAYALQGRYDEALAELDKLHLGRSGNSRTLYGGKKLFDELKNNHVLVSWMNGDPTLFAAFASTDATPSALESHPSR